MWSRLTRQLIETAVEEDLGAAGDITSSLLTGTTNDVCARIVPRQSGVICGLALGPAVCEAFFRRLGTPLDFVPAPGAERAFCDGDAVEAGQTVAHLRGTLEVVLAAERTLLNFLGRMSGVATLTRRYVHAARKASPDVKILDTRKTVPGWRELDKYAVRVGGGRNHRMGLYDAVLLKDNHLAGLAGERLVEALAEWLQVQWPDVGPEPDAGGSAASLAHPPAFVEVEVDGLAQLAEVCKVPGIDMVLLDNFSLDDLRAAVRHRDAQSLRGRLALEASGGVTLESVAAIAATGVDRISVGALTHSAAALDIGLDL